MMTLTIMVSTMRKIGAIFHVFSGMNCIFCVHIFQDKISSYIHASLHYTQNGIQRNRQTHALIRKLSTGGFLVLRLLSAA